MVLLGILLYTEHFMVPLLPLIGGNVKEPTECRGLLLIIGGHGFGDF